MTYDDIYEDGEGTESPVEGKGEEMLPERGIPFDDDDPSAGMISDFDEDDVGVGSEPRDLTPEELVDLLDETLPNDMGAVPEAAAEPDSGLGAGQPILTAADFAAEPALAGIEVPLPGEASTTGAPLYAEMALEDIGPTVGVPEVEAPDTTRHLDSVDDMLDFFITKEALRALWNRVEAAQVGIRNKVPNLDIARSLMDQLERARNELMGGRENFEEAERSVSEVELQITVIERAQVENKNAIYLFVYQLYWLAFVVCAWIWLVPMLRNVVINSLDSDTIALFPTLGSDLVFGPQTALIGVVGGIAGAFFALVRHVSAKLDFSKSYSMWYITNPLMGMIWGGFVFMVMRAGMLSLTAGSGDAAEITSAWALYLLAFIVGFQQNVANDIIRRILKIFQLGDSGSSSSGDGN
ncbi:MAG: hypothetical protein JXB38_11435 [Anaerolineales bacterium]|nr:hypothetical protein [Anaerolineales bacterium]